MQMGDYMEISTILEKIINTEAGKIFLQINGDCVYSESDLLRTIKGIVEVAPQELIREKSTNSFWITIVLRFSSLLSRFYKT